MYCIGLTGTIASGKSTAADFFAQLGVNVLNADDIARELTAPNQPAFQKIQAHFGHQVIMDNGHLNRRELRHLIFTHPHERLWLEQLLHPLIRQEIQHRIQHSQGSYCMVEIPLLKKREDYPYLNRVLLITADRSQQIARIMERDQCTEDHAIAILNTQPAEQNYQKLADDVVLNDGSIANLQQKLLKLHEMYLHLK